MACVGSKPFCETAGFDPGYEALAAHAKVEFLPITITTKGYVYIWVSNESEATKVWFDDLAVTHNLDIVTQATDYGPWGDVVREQKTNELDIYRYAYQGQYAEKDEETGWEHFERREYDNLIGRSNTTDPEKQYHSSYTWVGNNPVNNVDPDGAYSWAGALWRNAWYGGDGIYKSGDEWGYNKSANTFTELNGMKFRDMESFFGSPNNKNFNTAASMTFDWMTGRGEDNRTFINDNMANAFRDARVVNQARDYWYREVNAGNKSITDGLTNFLGARVWSGGNFGVSGVYAAGTDAAEQFVGSFTPEIRSDGNTLTFSIKNTTSFKSLMYGVAPDWKRSSFRPGGNMTQTYIFTEAIDCNRIVHK